MTEIKYEERVRDDAQGLRERKQKQNLQESPNRPSSPYSNSSSSLSSNDSFPVSPPSGSSPSLSSNDSFPDSLPSDSLIKNIKDELTNAYHRFYQAITFKKSLIFLAVLIFFYFLTLLPRNVTPHSPFFHKFTHETNQVFEQINSVDLPASSTIMKHTVSCRNAANMVQHSPAFEKHGSQIASGLREFGEKIMEAGRSLQNMYNRGSSVYKAFDIEIEAMMERLSSSYMRQGDAKFFKERLNKLTKKVQEFRKYIEKAQSSVLNAEEIRHDTEGYIHDGLREAEKFIESNDQQSQYVVDVAKAKKELMFVNNLLGHLNNTAVYLDKIRKILANYEDKLLDVESELGDTSNEENIFEVTKEDIKYLKSAVSNLKLSHDKFQSLSSD